MIGYLKGRILDVTPEHVLVESAGGSIGYEVQINGRWLSDLMIAKMTQPEVPKGPGLSVEDLHEFWIYTHVREDALQLFGFESRAQKGLFLSLLKVNGVGPKLALGIISAAPTEELVQSIETGDAKKLSKFPRVGKKTAEQIILSLQGKLIRVEDLAPAKDGTHKQIIFALKNLGFKENVVLEFVEQLAVTVSVEEGVRQGLQALSNARGEL